jgi:hypothetical protein
LLIVFALIVGFNVAAMVAVARSRLYEREQLLYQFILIWIIPVVGAILCWSLSRPAERLSSTDDDHGDSMDDDDLGLGNYAYDGTQGNSDAVGSGDV